MAKLNYGADLNKTDLWRAGTMVCPLFFASFWSQEPCVMMDVCLIFYKTMFTLKFALIRWCHSSVPVTHGLAKGKIQTVFEQFSCKYQKQI